MPDATPNPQPQRRENPEPHEARHPVPVAVVALVAGLLGWAGGYLMAARPDASPALGDQRTLDAPAGAAAAIPAGTTQAIDGAQVYAANCMACHQANGAGVPKVFPPLAGSEWVRGDERVLVQILLHGASGALEVAGQQYNGAMPAFGQTLGDAEIAAVATYIRGEWGNAAGAITPAAVEAARAETRDRDTPWNGGAELRTLARLR